MNEGGHHGRSAAAWLPRVLWLCALHSAGVGIGLLLLPSDLLPRFGLAGGGTRFFQAQGGTFHLLMAAGYVLAALDPAGRRPLVVFAVLVKVVATLFLVTCLLVGPRGWIVAVSAAGDGLLAALLVAADRHDRGAGRRGG